ncbi:predicted protein [Naegleria gruberi]|uniref:Predicted protein n=1 Tax=Naegleria gruberi TaxID=5762 RepID=D2VP82_NAEGR|nr:uncharacterized protein NAEGRDRAFT_51168 [Naegleria gruberi]EFC41385.1 predicted protein [Naegleria gruberi]|eukprot:XP_002674129.1 predicted protein [Naegleria gruberi strain NEG-M]
MGTKKRKNTEKVQAPTSSSVANSSTVDTAQSLKKKKSKKWQEVDTERLRLFWLANRGKVYQTNKDAFVAFANENGYSWSQVQRKYKSTIKDKSSIEMENKKAYFEEQSAKYADELVRVKEAKKRKLEAPKVVDDDEEEDESEYETNTDDSSSSEDSSEESLFRTPSKSHITKTVKYETDLLAFHHFETATKHIFAIRYPSHLKFVFQGVSRKERQLLIDVSIETILDSKTMQKVLDEIEFDVGVIHEKQSGTTSLYTLKQYIPKDGDMQTLAPIETEMDSDGNKIFVIVCDKKVDIVKPARAVMVYSKKKKIDSSNATEHTQPNTQPIEYSSPQPATEAGNVTVELVDNFQTKDDKEEDESESDNNE